MKSIKIAALTAAAALSLLSAGSFAQRVSVTASTLDGAEAKVAAIAQQTHSQYKITGASSNNLVRMTANISHAQTDNGLSN